MTYTPAELAAALEWMRALAGLEGVHPVMFEDQAAIILAEYERLKLELKRTKESLDCAQENFSVTNAAYIKRDQVCQMQAETIRETNKEVEALKARLAEFVEASRHFAAMRLSSEHDSVSNPENRSKELQELMEWRDKPIQELRDLLKRTEGET